MFIEQIPAGVILFLMLYGGAAIAAAIASIYLCQHNGNVFAADITPPERLRRWAAAFFAVAFLSHVWWYLFCIYSGDIYSVSYSLVSLFDGVMVLTTIAGTLLAMLQDRKRPIWPMIIANVPFAILMALNIVYPAEHFLIIAVVYILIVYVLFSVYMAFAVRQYGRWLRDNYADLEHKEVWVSHMLVFIVLISIINDGFDTGDMTVSCLLQIIELVLFSLLLWRIETLPKLEDVAIEETCTPPAPEPTQEQDLPIQAQQPKQQLAIPSNIEQLLAEHCVGMQLYLQPDLTVSQLARTIGINRLYLSHYFSRRGTTYNAYINDLRINHFVRLYQEAVAAHRPFTAQELACDSGYQSYSTFSLAFKQRMGQTVTAWMHNSGK